MFRTTAITKLFSCTERNVCTFCGMALDGSGWNGRIRLRCGFHGVFVLIVPVGFIMDLNDSTILAIVVRIERG